MTRHLQKTKSSWSITLFDELTEKNLTFRFFRGSKNKYCTLEIDLQIFFSIGSICLLNYQVRRESWPKMSVELLTHPVFFNLVSNIELKEIQIFFSCQINEQVNLPGKICWRCLILSEVHPTPLKITRKNSDQLIKS